MAKKIRVHNSPFERDFEKPSDIARWFQQGIVYALGNGEYSFTSAFAEAVRREILQTRSCDPGFDDGVLRRWVKRLSGGMPTKQLRPVRQVGTMRGTTRNPDRMKRRHRVAPVRTLTADGLAPSFETA